MARLIDIDVFRQDNKFAEECKNCKREKKWDCDRQMYSARDICGWLDDAEIVDAAGMKHGKWVRVSGYCTPGGDPVWKCSECGKGVHVYGIEHGTYGADISDGQWVACPNCGAIIDGEEY